MGLAAPGLASSTGRAGGAARGAPAFSGARARTPTSKTTNFAGYGVKGTGGGTWKVSAHLVVPKVKCTSKTERAIDASVGVYGQSKNRFSSAGVFVGCYKGKAQYFLAFVVNGTPRNFSKLAVRRGDTVALHVSQSSASTVVSATDKSRNGVKKTLHGAGNTVGGGPWVGDTAWDNPGELGVPDFGKLHFSKAKLNGMAFGTAGGSALVRYYRAKGTTLQTIQIKTGKLIAGKSFTTTFKHS
jgi:hypothetical protein